MIYVKTGEGGGKTTSAIGLAVRAIGHGKTVYILQFMKKRQTGELILRKFKNCVIRRFGRKEFVNLKKPEQIDAQYMHQQYSEMLTGLPTTLLVLSSGEADLLA